MTADGSPAATRTNDDDEAARARAFDDAVAKARRGEPLSAKDFATILRIEKSQFNRRELAGAFDAFKLKPELGFKRFSGALVARYLDGEPLFEDLRGRARLRVVSRT